MRAWLQRNPWFWIVLLLGVLVLANLLFVLISVLHQPVRVAATG